MDPYSAYYAWAHPWIDERLIEAFDQLEQSAATQRNSRSQLVDAYLIRQKHLREAKLESAQ